jgi:hypothetical protein
MNTDNGTLQQMRELIDRSLEGTISGDQVKELERLITESAQSVGYYCEYLNASLGVERFYSKSSIPAMWEQSTQLPDRFWNELAQEERNAPALQIEKAIIAPTAGPIIKPRTSRGSKTAFMVAAISMAALLMLIAYVQNVPSKTGTAMVSSVLQPVWPSAKDRAVPGQWLYNTDASRFLESGTIQLEFLSGAKAIIEGPAEFVVLTDDQIKLTLGKLYATVPPEAAGFVVRTPGTRVIDLGTEFGVIADSHGNTEVHVFRGKTMLMAGGDRQENYIETISSGSARAVSSVGMKVQDISPREDIFVRAVDMKNNAAWRSHRLSLADFVGGGNGLGTGLFDYGILVDSGACSLGPLSLTGHGQNKLEPNVYRTVGQVAAIDGVFVPDGGNGPVVVSSQGDLFNDCPETNGCWSAPIINGTRYNSSSQQRLTFNGVTYGTPEKPALFLHANIGITFDLAAIRDGLPEGMSPDRFVTLVAAPMNIYNYPDSRFDVHILVDGQVRAFETGMEPHQSFPVDIDLTGQDRFLSIVITDGTDGKPKDGIPSNHCDWCLLIQPELLLQMN